MLQIGCAQPGKPVIAERSPVLSGENRRSYVVQPGDTLYSIAWRFELDHQGLARANSIRSPYTIYPGQSLRLVVQLPTGSRVSESSTASAKQAPKRTAAPRPAAPAATRETDLRWVWPLRVPPSRNFGGASKGMDFRLSAATDTARAAAAGEVVYAGTGIGGFERLVIIKHNRALLSAYSFDGALKVREQQQVDSGRAIAEIRRRGPAQQALHFELRRDGKPINPRQYLR